MSVLEHLRAARPPSELYKSGKIPKRSVMRALAELKSVGLIRKIGYGTYEINEPSTGKDRRCQIIHPVVRTHTPKKVPNLKPDMTRAHGIVATVKVPVKNFTSELGNGETFISWSKDNLAQVLEGRKIPFTPIPQGQRIRVLDVQKVWLTPKSVVFYLPYSWYGETVQDCATRAMEDTIRLIRSLERMLGIPDKLKLHGSYWIKFSRQHDALIKNALAEMYDNPRRPLYFRDQRGQWGLIDNSFNLHELETTRGEKDFHPIKPDKPIGPQVRQDDDGAREHNRKVVNWFNGVKDTGITPEFILERFAETASAIKEVNGHMGHYSSHLKTHVSSIDRLGGRVDNLAAREEENTKMMVSFREAVEHLAATTKLITMPAALQEKLAAKAKKPPSEPLEARGTCALCGHRGKLAPGSRYCKDCDTIVKEYRKPGRMSSLGEFGG